MSDSVKLSKFPSNESEALAFLYVQNQDLSGKTPAEIQEIYYNAYYEISKDRRAKTKSGWFKEKLEEAMR